MVSWQFTSYSRQCGGVCEHYLRQCDVELGWPRLQNLLKSWTNWYGFYAWKSSWSWTEHLTLGLSNLFWLCAKKLAHAWAWHLKRLAHLSLDCCLFFTLLSCHDGYSSIHFAFTACDQTSLFGHGGSSGWHQQMNCSQRFSSIHKGL